MAFPTSNDSLEMSYCQGIASSVVDRAEQSLNTAKGELEKAGDEWGGTR